jgi:class 3 adenylate cyclase
MCFLGLVADEVVAAAEPDGARIEALGRVRLKGFTRPVRLRRLPAWRRGRVKRRQGTTGQLRWPLADANARRR